MNDRLLEELLHEREKENLDFKRDQYPFEGASNAAKSRLLKDILAMANAWRREPAFILIGVDETEGGGRAVVVGVEDHLKDADLQQFVNQKTQKPVTFAYYAYQFEEKSIGIIELPVLMGKRPFFLVFDYGNLKKETVYLRRGSANEVAGIDDIAEMGRVAGATERGASPILKLKFADLEDRQVYEEGLVIDCLVLDPIDPELLKPRSVTSPFSVTFDLGKNPTFYEELVEYARLQGLMCPVGFSILNDSEVAADDVQVLIEIPRQDDLFLLDDATYPSRPWKYSGSIPGQFHEPDPKVTKFSEGWEIATRWDRVLPQKTEWSQSPFYIGAAREMEFQVTARIFAVDLPRPIEQNLPIGIKNVEHRKMERQDIVPWIDDS